MTVDEFRLGSETLFTERLLGTNSGWHRHTLILRIISAQRHRHRAPAPSKFVTSRGTRDGLDDGKYENAE
eukprot:12421977-Heterocapsa_arctica.AAC.1